MSNEANNMAKTTVPDVRPVREGDRLTTLRLLAPGVVAGGRDGVQFFTTEVKPDQPENTVRAAAMVAGAFGATVATDRERVFVPWTLVRQARPA